MNARDDLLSRSERLRPIEKVQRFVPSAVVTNTPAAARHRHHHRCLGARRFLQHRRLNRARSSLAVASVLQHRRGTRVASRELSERHRYLYDQCLTGNDIVFFLFFRGDVDCFLRCGHVSAKASAVPARL